MKHTFQWTLAVVCLFVVGNTQVMASDDEEVKTVLIPLTTGKPLNGGGHRSITIPFTAYYQGGTIFIDSSAEFSSIDINVLNEVTGQVWSTTVGITDGMGEICVSDGGAGSYTIVILTEYGECFAGRFTLYD